MTSYYTRKYGLVALWGKFYCQGHYGVNLEEYDKLLYKEIWISCTMGQILLSGSLLGEFGGLGAVIVKSEWEELFSFFRY